MGAKLHRLRTAQNISLRDLALKTLISPSHLSAIERSVTHPSVATLQRISAALGTNMIQLTGEQTDDQKLVVRPHERPELDIPLPGVKIQQHYRVSTVLESLLFIVAPGADCRESYNHDGEEFLFMLEGSVTIILDETEKFDLSTGDAITFLSHRPHRFINTSDQEAKILWVNTPPTF
mgnify:CR=1 FL=1